MTEESTDAAPLTRSCDTASVVSTKTPAPCSTHDNVLQMTTDRKSQATSSRSLWEEIVADFDTAKGGDRKILRAIGRTATVNAAVAVAALTGGAATGLVGFATGGAITAKRFGDGIEQNDSKEVVKSVAVYASATTASVVGQIVTGALMVGVAGASLPVAAAVAFAVGCGSGITAGALSEWTVDSVFQKGGKFWSLMADNLLGLLAPADANNLLRDDHVVLKVH